MDLVQKCLGWTAWALHFCRMRSDQLEVGVAYRTANRHGYPGLPMSDIRRLTGRWISAESVGTRRRVGHVEVAIGYGRLTGTASTVTMAWPAFVNSKSFPPCVRWSAILYSHPDCHDEWMRTTCMAVGDLTHHHTRHLRERGVILYSNHGCHDVWTASATCMAAGELIRCACHDGMTG